MLILWKKPATTVKKELRKVARGQTLLIYIFLHYLFPFPFFAADQLFSGFRVDVPADSSRSTEEGPLR